MQINKLRKNSITKRSCILCMIFIASVVFFSCGALIATDQSNTVFSTTAKLGNNDHTVVKLQFNKNIGKIDRSKFDIHIDEVFSILEKRDIHKFGTKLKLENIFFWENNIYLITKGNAKNTDVITVVLHEGSIYDESKNIIDLGDNTYELTQLQALPPQIVFSIAVADKKQLYIFFDTHIENINKDKISVRMSGNIEPVSKARVLDKDDKIAINILLAAYGYNPSDTGFSAEDIVGHIAEVTTESNFKEKDIVLTTLSEGAVKSVATKEMPRAISLSSIQKIEPDGIPPMLTETKVISSSTDQKIVLSFDESIIGLGNKACFQARVDEISYLVDQVIINPENNKQVILKTKNPIPPNKDVAITLCKNAVQDKSGTGNEEDSNPKISNVGDEAPADTIAPEIIKVSAIDKANTIVGVEFSEIVTVVDPLAFKVQVLSRAGGTASSASKSYATAQAMKATNVARVGTTGDDARKVTLTLSDGFNGGEKIIVSVLADAVADSVGNKNVGNTQGVTATVFDTTGPVLQSIQASDITPTQVTLLFDEALQPSPNTNNFRVQINNGALLIPTKAVRDTDNHKSIIVTLGQAFLKGNTIKATLLVAAVADTTSPKTNANLVDTNGKTTTVIDKAPPKLESISANDGGNKKTVTVVFNEELTNTATLTAASFKINGVSAAHAVFDASDTTSRTIVLTAASAFSQGDSLRVTLLAGAVQDTTTQANKSIADNTGVTTVVTDGIPPRIVKVSAKANSGIDKRVIVQFSKAITLVDATKLLVQVETGTAQDASTATTTYATARAITANNAVVDTTINTNIRLTLEGDFAIGNIIKVTLEEGAVADRSVNTNKNAKLEQATADSTGIVQDGNKPFITQVLANDGASRKVVVVFNKAVTVVDASRFKVQATQGQGDASEATGANGYATAKAIEAGPANNANANAVVDVIDATKVTLTLASAFKIQNGIKIMLDAGAVKDTSANTNANEDNIEESGIVTDGTRPKIAKVSASDKANTAVVVEFSEIVTVVDPTAFKVQVLSRAGGTASSASKSYATAQAMKATNVARVGATGDDARKVTLTLSDGFNGREKIIVSVLAGAVADNAGNKNVGNTQGVTAIVLDTTGPVLQSIQASDITPTQVTLLFDEALQPSPNTNNFRVQINNGALLIPTKAVRDTDNHKSIIVTLGQAFLKGNTIKATLLVAAVADTTSPKANANLVDTNGKTTTAIDEAPPKLESISANDGGNKKTVTVVFNEELTNTATLTAASFKINGVSAAHAVFDASDTTSRTIVLTAASAFSQGDSLRVTLLAGAVQDTTTQANKSIADNTGVTTVVTDGIPPRIVKVSASANSGVDQRVIVQFSKAVTVVDATKLLVQVETGQGVASDASRAYTNIKAIASGPANNQNANAVVDTTINTNIRLTLEGDFAIGNIIKVTLEEGAVADRSVNTNKNAKLEQATAESTGIVQDGNKPFITQVLANDRASRKVVVVFNKAVTVVDATKFKVQATQGQGDASEATGANGYATAKAIEAGPANNANANAVVDVIDATKVTLTLASAFKIQNVIKIILDAGAVKDTSANTNANEDNIGGSGTVTDNTSPKIAKVSANDNTNTEIIVEFDEVVTVVDATKFKVQVETGTGTASAATKAYANPIAITANNVARVGVTGDNAKKVRLTLTAAFKVHNTIKVTMDAGAVQDTVVAGQTANKNVVTPASVDTTVIDRTPPTLQSIDVISETQVELVFDEAISTADTNKIKVNAANNGTSTASKAVIDTADAKKVTITATLLLTEKVTVTLDAGAVQDTVVAGQTANFNLADTTGKTTSYRMIFTVQNLEDIATNATTLADTYKLIQDITLTKTYSDSVIAGSFTGEFNGNGKKITNLNLNLANTISSRGYGLFRALDGNGTIKNLTVEIGTTFNVLLANTWVYVGVVTGRMLGNNTIDNVHVRNPNNTEFTQTETNSYVFGGISGGNYHTTNTTLTIKNSSVDNIRLVGKSRSATIGGLIGLTSSEIIITNSYVTGNFKTALSPAGSVGGLIGEMHNKAFTVTDSYVVVDITIAFITEFNPVGDNIGLIVGQDDTDQDITLTRVWAQSTATDTKLVNNRDADVATHVYSNVKREKTAPTGNNASKGALLFDTTQANTNLPSGFSTTIWERAKGSTATPTRPTLKNNPEK